MIRDPYPITRAEALRDGVRLLLVLPAFLAIVITAGATRSPRLMLGVLLGGVFVWAFGVVAEEHAAKSAQSYAMIRRATVDALLVEVGRTITVGADAPMAMERCQAMIVKIRGRTDLGQTDRFEAIQALQRSLEWLSPTRAALSGRARAELESRELLGWDGTRSSIG